ncbi:MAG: hypothetical protein RLZZ540_284 [Bacteroidota bacterium]|jgi:hypothetical protein
MEIEVGNKKPIIEIYIEKDFAESARFYYEKTKEYYILSGPNPFLSLKLIDKGNQNGIPNTAGTLEINDVVRGFFDANTYWNAAYYLGGNPALISSWQPVGASIITPVVPNIPNPNPPPTPPAPGTPDFLAVDFLINDFKI